MCVCWGGNHFIQLLVFLGHPGCSSSTHLKKKQALLYRSRWQWHSFAKNWAFSKIHGMTKQGMILFWNSKPPTSKTAALSQTSKPTHRWVCAWIQWLYLLCYWKFIRFGTCRWKYLRKILWYFVHIHLKAQR